MTSCGYNILILLNIIQGQLLKSCWVIDSVPLSCLVVRMLHEGRGAGILPMYKVCVVSKMLVSLLFVAILVDFRSAA